MFIYFHPQLILSMCDFKIILLYFLILQSPTNLYCQINPPYILEYIGRIHQYFICNFSEPSSRVPISLT
jgi:hypothetical protein